LEMVSPTNTSHGNGYLRVCSMKQVITSHKKIANNHTDTPVEGRER
jgi:hypothetical protein